jgi:serine/threonine protein kinase
LALTPGTRFGVYEVTAQIGEGGMGQVYRARDTKLNRGGGGFNSQSRLCDVARDGGFLINTVVEEASAPVTLLRRWHPEGKK